MRAPEHIILEEAVYRDTFPLVRFVQGFWMGSLALFSLMFLVLLLFFKPFVDAIVLMQGWFNVGFEQFGLPTVHLETWKLLLSFAVIAVVMLCGYYVLCIWLATAVCQLRRWIGVVGLLYCVPMFLSLTGVIVVIAAIMIFESRNGGPQKLLLVLVGLQIYCALLFYMVWVLARISWRFAFTPLKIRKNVAELFGRSRSERLAKIMGMPIPFKYIQKNRRKAIAFFIVAAICLPASMALMFGAVTNLPYLIKKPLVATGQGVFLLEGYRINAHSSGLPPQFTAVLESDYFRILMSLIHYASLLCLALSVGFLYLAKAAREKARNLSIASLEETREFDTRHPVLFLRPFYDDRVRLPKPRLSVPGRIVNFMNVRTVLDILLLEEATAFGPVVAVGNPSDPIPRYGLATQRLADETWQDGVTSLVRESTRIVLCVDLTDGVLWEMRHILEKGYMRKTLFLFHPDARNPEKNKVVRECALVQLRAFIPLSINLSALEQPAAPVLGFFIAGDMLEVALSTEFSESSYLLMVRWFLRATSEMALLAEASREIEGELVAFAGYPAAGPMPPPGSFDVAVIAAGRQ